MICAAHRIMCTCLSLAGDLVALFDDDETDEVKQERNEVDMLALVSYHS